jgi:hypothetical protein
MTCDSKLRPQRSASAAIFSRSADGNRIVRPTAASLARAERVTPKKYQNGSLAQARPLARQTTGTSPLRYLLALQKRHPPLLKFAIDSSH